MVHTQCGMIGKPKDHYKKTARNLYINKQKINQ